MIYYFQATIQTLMRICTPGDDPQNDIDAAVRILKNGGVVAVPTDTLYGLAANPFDEAAVERIFRLKGRSKTLALPLLLADADDISKYAKAVPELASTMVNHFWPGTLTIVLNKSDAIPESVSGGADTIALRVPDHSVPRAIARKLGVPITGTSANRSGESAFTTAEAVRREFGDELDLIVCGGETPSGLASTVLDLSSDPPGILRQGAIPRRDIEKLCPERLAP